MMFTYTTTTKTTENRRDRLAEYVFKEKIANLIGGTPEGLAEYCYQYADAMIAAGEVEEEEVEEAPEEPRVVRINLNTLAAVKLNEFGKNIHNQFCERMQDGSRPVAEDGWIECSLAKLMHVFGQHVYLFDRQPFISDIEVIE